MLSSTDDDNNVDMKIYVHILATDDKSLASAINIYVPKFLVLLLKLFSLTHNKLFYHIRCDIN